MRLWGTGFVVDRHSHLLTADHVTRDCAEITAYRNGARTEAIVVARDSDDDLSLLQTKGELGAPVAFAGNGKAAGPLVLIASYPELVEVVDDGAPHRMLFNGMVMGPSQGAAARRLYIVSDARPGSSGSPVVDGGGFVAAIVTAKVSWHAAAARPNGVGEVRMATSATAAKDFLRGNAIDFLDEAGAFPAHPSRPGELLARSEVRIECRG
jgi:S1-C subfamily serine protease